MEIHPYHFLLLKYLISQKLKGNYLLPLCNDDCAQIGRPHAIDVSVGYLQKLLKPNCSLPERLAAYTLNQLAMYAGYETWNEYLRQNPVPPDKYHDLLNPKAARLLEKIVKQHLEKKLRNTAQLVMEFAE
ncbi:MAG: hypothetical protein POELPBGB_00591 [Bacteroidia bacterium]|nr:hypothetical protein [Bacteroidia bacterium]